MMNRQEIAEFLATTDEAKIEQIRSKAESILLKECGNKVYFRGLVEASNICTRDCYYCGIRKFNKAPKRYQMSTETVIELAKQAKDMGYASFVLQTGERQDARFIDYIETILRKIKEQTFCDDLPDGLGITLCIGEQTKETYQRFYDAGVHRYLLRIETTNPDLFAKIHPPEQRMETRLESLKALKEIGYQVGTGVMIGLPEQTSEDLAKDILFFKEHDIDMIGMGPFIPDPLAVPLGECMQPEKRVRVTLLMIALTRIVLKDVNIAATTALQVLEPHAREQALRFGANVMMPLFTPQIMRKDYNLYPKKSMQDESSLSFHKELETRIQEQGREIGYNQWGDAPHARKKKYSTSH